MIDSSMLIFGCSVVICVMVCINAYLVSTAKCGDLEIWKALKKAVEQMEREHDVIQNMYCIILRQQKELDELKKKVGKE